MNNQKRTRNFVAIGYPESLKENWIDILCDTHVQFVISPLHDKDVNPDGEIKKEHYHIMIMYESPHTYEQAQKIFDKICATNCQVVNSSRGQARYMCHLDNPEKYQYNITDVKCLNGADYQELIELESDNRATIKEIINFIKENNIVSYSQIIDVALDNEKWFRLLTEKYTIFLSEYIKSKRWLEEVYGGSKNLEK